MTPPAPHERLDVWEPPAVEALGALRAAPADVGTWTRTRVVAAAVLAAPVLLTLVSALPAGAEPTVVGWALLAVAAASVSATLATYLPRGRPTRVTGPSSPCSVSALVLLALAWLMAGSATSTAALVPVAVIGLGSLVQRLLTAPSCAPRG